MGSESWSLTAKLCDSCKTTPANLFCRADSAFLCTGCDTRIHAANKLASRHARVWMCEVCEQAPATVTCKADAAALCVTCDRDIHSANPLARRHERFPVVPFYDSVTATKVSGGGEEESRLFDEVDGEDEEETEAEAASWLLGNPNPNPNKVMDTTDLNRTEYLFSDMDSYIDMDIISSDQKPQQYHNQYQQHSSDGVVPVQSKNCQQQQPNLQPPVLVDGFPTYEIDYSGSKPLMYNFSSQSISQSVSSSSLDVGVVPDQNAISDVSTNFTRNDTVPNPVSGMDREARVLRYREKRKNRKFEKTIRYASRKAYAETRPRIKGRFAKRSDKIEVGSLISGDASYGVVPNY